MSLFWLCLPISYVLCGCFHKNITKKAKLCSWQPVWVNNQRAHGCFACIGCLSPVRFGLCLYPERLQTMLWYHNAQLYLLNNQYNEYNWALWHHSIVWCSFGSKQTSKSHNTWVCNIFLCRRDLLCPSGWKPECYFLAVIFWELLRRLWRAELIVCLTAEKIQCAVVQLLLLPSVLFLFSKLTFCQNLHTSQITYFIVKQTAYLVYCSEKKCSCFSHCLTSFQNWNCFFWNIVHATLFTSGCVIHSQDSN